MLDGDGRQARQRGPLALKRELRETEGRLAKLEADLEQAQKEADALSRAIEELTAQPETRGEERRQAKARPPRWARR